MELFFSRQYSLVTDKYPSMILIYQYFCSLFIKQYFDMEDPPGNSPLKYHNIFSQKLPHIWNTKVLSSI